MDLNQLLQNCESEIETHLLRALYSTLGPDSQEDLRTQHVIDYYNDLPVTLPDFAFPEAKIAIYCDGYEHHSDTDSFQKDRQQSRELQLQGWFVLRFSGSEILNDTEAVVFTIQRAIKQKLVQKANRQAFADFDSRWKTEKEKREGGSWGLFVGTLIVAFVVIILIDYFFNVF